MSLRHTGACALLVTLAVACGSDDSPSGGTDALDQLGISEGDAERYALDAVATGQPYGIVGTAGQAFKSLADDGRREVIEGATAWARRYFESDLFRNAYAERRARSKPSPREYEESVDDEVERRVQQGLEEIEQARSNVLPMLPEADRPEMLKSLESMKAQYQDPAFAEMQRQGIEMQRAAEQRSYDESLARWDRELPEDPDALIKRRLQKYLAACDDVDFDAELVEKNGRLRFVNAGYEQKSWEWKLCYRAGEESVAAAREAAEDWIDSLE